MLPVKRQKRSVFQFTHPRGVRLLLVLSLVTLVGFNSRTREGCDLIEEQARGKQLVSIHAPARGAIARTLFLSGN